MSEVDGKAVLLEYVRIAHALAVFHEDSRVRAVAMAHDAGASWTEIGGQMGLSRQAAHQRFARLIGAQ